jgi:hypothetical protein
VIGHFSSLPWPRRAEPREREKRNATAWLAGMAAPAPAVPTRRACALHMFLEQRRTGSSPFVSRSRGRLMGIPATCGNKARACEIRFFRCCYCCCWIPDVVTLAEITRPMAGMDERAREKKSVGRGGSSLRKLFPSAVGWGPVLHSWQMLCAFPCGQDRSGYRWPAMQMLGGSRETFSASGLPCLFAARVLSCVGGCE